MRNGSLGRARSSGGSTGTNEVASADSADRLPVGDATRERLAVSVDEAARLLGVSKDLVYDLIARGELPAIRLGRRLVVALISLQELLAGQPDRTGVAPEASTSIS